LRADERRARLGAARLYLCTAIRDDTFLNAALGAGVDMIQLRDKDADAVSQLRAAERFRAAADRHGALFIFNDRADLAIAANADGVHVGQEDLPPHAARALVGPDMLIGRSTHSDDELRRAHDEPVDYIGVGPVSATPTKPGRPGVGLALIRSAAAHATLPWFVTGGMDAHTIPSIKAEGATRFVVVRAITEADDAAEAVRAIRVAIDA